MPGMMLASALSRSATPCHPSLCPAGLMRLRYSPNMTIFLEAWQTALDEGGSEVWDQGQFNHLLRLGMFLNHGSFWDHTPDHDRSVSGRQAEWQQAACACLRQGTSWSPACAVTCKYWAQTTTLALLTWLQNVQHHPPPRDHPPRHLGLP